MKQLLLISFLSITTLSLSQSESIDYTLDSEIFNEERTISVFLPESYNSEDSTEEFPVAYLFDGQFQPYFSMTSSIMSYYEQTNEGIPMIVVGIHTKNRWGEFVPICKGEETNDIEGADKLTLFLKNEVVPLIESKYRTKSFKIGVGHSLGGTYILNEIIKENSLFDAVIAVSPNLTICKGQIIKNAQDFFNNNPDNRKFIYTSAGTMGDMENNFRTSLLRLDSLRMNMDLKNMYWNCEILKKHNHMTTFVPSFDAGYLLLSSKLALKEDELIKMAEDPTLTIVAHLTDFYNDLAKFSHEKGRLGIDQIMKHAATLAQHKKFTACVELFRYASERLENEDISSEKKKEMSEMISGKQVRAEFNGIAQEADKLATAGDFINAGNLYVKAFDMNILKATHIVRVDAIPVLAQAGKIEEAFKQLDLLANTFELGSNNQFIDDPLCKPLHKDKRWKKLMDKLDKNGELYR